MAGRLALVTGSTSGIGYATARALASKGCSILLTGFGDEADIQERKTQIQTDYKVPVSYFGGDLSKTDDIDAMCRAIREKHPAGVDILVNNAGFQFTSPVEEFPLDKWTSMMSVMLTAPFLLTKHFLPDMKTRGWGRIVNISSVHGLVASINKSAYVAAKHGLIGFTKVVALEEARTGVTCNAICPGCVATELFNKQLEDRMLEQGITAEQAMELMMEKQPSRSFISVEQVGDAVTYLCSSSCDGVTGISLPLDGGWTAT